MIEVKRNTVEVLHQTIKYIHFSHFKHSFWKQREKYNQDCPNDLCLILIDHRREKKMDKKWKEKGKLCNDLLTPKNSKKHKVGRLWLTCC